MIYVSSLRRVATAFYTPSAALGSCRYKLQAEDPARAIEILRRYDMRYVLYIGGNDSADTAHRLAQAAQQSNYDLQTISVPKTIDNDLPFTDHCPGYGSAARFIAQATMRFDHEHHLDSLALSSQNYRDDGA